MDMKIVHYRASFSSLTRMSRMLMRNCSLTASAMAGMSRLGYIDWDFGVKLGVPT